MAIAMRSGEIMGLRFRRSAKLGPFRITATKRGLSTSFGVRGARVGINSRGQVRRTIGLPGTGIYDTEIINPSTGSHVTHHAAAPASAASPAPGVPSTPSPPSAPPRHQWLAATIIGVLVAAMLIIGIALNAAGK